MVEPSVSLQTVFDKAINDAKKLKHEYVTLEHLLFAMLCEESFEKLIQNFEADADLMRVNLENHLKTKLDDIKTDEKKYKPKKTNSVERVLNRAFAQVLFQGRTTIDIVDVFVSILSEKRSYAFFVTQQADISKENFIKYVGNDDHNENHMELEDQGSANKALRAFTSDLNEDVKSGKIDPVIGREDEIEQVTLALGRRTKSNALIMVLHCFLKHLGFYLYL